MSSKKFSANTAVAIVVANMIGTGVFTSLGFQLVDIQSTFVLMMLWLVGGVTALCGALTYAELGARLPRSGGEYNFLKEIYHPAAGFVSGWISATVGFAAPTALAAMTFGAYLEASLDIFSATTMAASLVVVLTLLHAFSRVTSGGVQSVFTVIKVLLILVFVTLVFGLHKSPESISLMPAAGDLTLLTSSAFAISLIYVNYAYTGWNVATYISSELESPERNIPLVLFSGTVLVLVLYLLLNYTFLVAAPMSAMEGRLEIGVIAAQSAFGPLGSKAMGVMLAVLLISTVSAMIIAGPRVLQVIGEDFRLFRVLSRQNAHGIPVIAIFVQAGVTLFFILTSTFESVLIFAGFVMGLNTIFAVAGVFILRRRQPVFGQYKTFGYPLTPLVFLGLMTWTSTYILFNRPMEGLAGLLIIASGFVLYWLTERFDRAPSEAPGSD